MSLNARKQKNKSTQPAMEIHKIMVPPQLFFLTQAVEKRIHTSVVRLFRAKTYSLRLRYLERERQGFARARKSFLFL